MTGFFLLCSLMVAARLFEIILAKSHEKILIEEGGIEVGADHYKWIVALHVSFFVSLIVEVLFRSGVNLKLATVPLILFLVIQVFRIWTIVSLGKYWNTKIIVLPGADLIKKGPYRWVKHPNYAIVALEIATFPLIFHAFVTSILFTLLNGAMMYVRIPVESQALEMVSHKK